MTSNGSTSKSGSLIIDEDVDLTEDEYFDTSSAPDLDLNEGGCFPNRRSNLPVARDEKISRAIEERAKNLEYMNETNVEKEWPKLSDEVSDLVNSMQVLGGLNASDPVPKFQRLSITGEDFSVTSAEDMHKFASMLSTALCIRQKYIGLSLQTFCSATNLFTDKFQALNKDEDKSQEFDLKDMKSHYFDNEPVYDCEMVDGVVQVFYKNKDCSEKTFVQFPLIKWRDFVADYKKMRKTYSFIRLSQLSKRFQFHTLLNEFNERTEQKFTNHRDFYNVRKVDTHVHAASCMNQKHLLRFIKHKLKTESGRIVAEDEDGNDVNLKQLFDSLNLTAHNLSVDKLDMHADRQTFHRFDRFSAKYNPIGLSCLRELFLKTENKIKGQYFAQLVKEVSSDMLENKYQMQELRFSIYGRSYDDFSKLADWFYRYNIQHPNLSIMIQVPRLYDVYKAKDSMHSFSTLLNNVFKPLFDATLNPSENENLFNFLNAITGFDSVDDESKHEYFGIEKCSATPENWTSKYNPPYCYYIYYMYANILQLNHLRKSKGLSTLHLRPHSGESGNVIHLMTTFMLAQNISHGLNLRKAAVLQYLYYLAQVGVAMSPLSNNSLFLDYYRNPCNQYMMQGLFISLSSDDPLQFHFTKEPLIEEYSVAAQVWKLSSVDMCELARNSVLMSSFPHKTKQHWLGENYLKEGVKGNDISQTNVPNIRIEYRYETLLAELARLWSSLNMT